MAAIVLLGSSQLFILGIMGEYLGRLYLEAKSRPLFVSEILTATEVEARKQVCRHASNPAGNLRLIGSQTSITLFTRKISVSPAKRRTILQNTRSRIYLTKPERPRMQTKI